MMKMALKYKKNSRASPPEGDEAALLLGLARPEAGRPAMRCYEVQRDSSCRSITAI